MAQSHRATEGAETPRVVKAAATASNTVMMAYCVVAPQSAAVTDVPLEENVALMVSFTDLCVSN